MKRFVTCVLCFCLCVMCAVPVASADKFMGDVDGDGKITSLDARMVLRVAAGIEPLSRKLSNTCDIDADGYITIGDAWSVLRMACNTIPLIPEVNNNDIIFDDVPSGVYSLKYEDENGVMVEYADICNMKVSVDNEEVFYDDLITQNCAPDGAVCIGVYDSNNVRVKELPLDALATSQLGEKLYSFGAISDTHIGSKTSDDDLKNALTYFENDKDIEFVTVCGDLSLGGTEENLSLYKKIVDENISKPVYAVSGNHETNASFAPLATESLKPYTGQDLYYTFEKGNDVYIMLGIHDIRNGYEFAEGELQWLYEVLEENKDKRCFLFLHLYPRDGSGDAVDLDLEGDMLNNTQGQVFYSLLSHYSNVLYFHGHSHESFALQTVHEMSNYDNIFGCHSIHVPSLAYPKKYSNGKLVADYDASEGYIVDVYENNVVLKGRDFVTGKFLPIATYSLDTTAKSVETGTFYDSTGTILNKNSNVLEKGKSWYKGSIDTSKITRIIFTDEYSGSYDECWDPTLAQNNNVIVYRDGTELFVDCSENGVSANADSSEMFADFSSLQEIVGFHRLNASNITKIESMFKNCSSLKNLDLSSFNSVNPENMKTVFYGCSSLEYIDISNFNLKGVNVFQNLCYGCTSLKSISFPNIDKTKTIYLSGAFGNCEALESIDMTKFSGTVYYGSTFSCCSSLKNITFGDTTPINVNNMFMNCSSIERIDVSNFDFSKITSFSQTFRGCSSLSSLNLPAGFNTSKVTTIRAMFRGCGKLTLDCSSWDTSALTDMTSFNEGSPGVIAPVVSGD